MYILIIIDALKNKYLTPTISYCTMELFSLSCGVYKCNFGLCRKSSRALTEAIVHSKLHNINGKYYCELCLLYTTNKPSVLKKHQEQRHTDNRVFACTLCEYTTVSMHKLNKHNEKHVLTSKRVLIIGKTGRPIIVLTLDCKYDNCSYQATDKYDLSNHVKQHINPLTRQNITEPIRGSLDMMKILTAVAIQEDLSLSEQLGQMSDVLIVEEYENIDLNKFPDRLVDMLANHNLHEESDDVSLIRALDDRSAEDPDYTD